MQRNSQEVQKMEQDYDLQVAELEQRINALEFKIEQLRAQIEANLRKRVQKWKLIASKLV